MDFGRALSFQFKDDRWFRKVLAPAACLCIPVLGFAAATGWALEICRRVIRGDSDELPAMDLRRNLKEGLSVWAIVSAYGMPVVLWLGAAALFAALVFPFGRASAPLAFDSFWWGIEFIAAAGILAAAMGSVAATGRFSETGTLREALHLREIASAVRAAPKEYLKVVLAWIPLGVLGVAGIAVCGAGIFFTTAYALGSGFHAAGQAHRLATSRRAPPDAAAKA
jgi:hypothetical protein